MAKLALTYVRASAVRSIARDAGKRVSPEFLLALDDHVRSRLNAACRVHNGGKKTLDATVLGFVTGRPNG